MTAERIIAEARDRGVTIATAESCTGGLISGALTDVPGSSDVFGFGFVTYANEAKITLLDVSAETLAQFGAVSEEVAADMAKGALARSGATLALSVTGIAGPGGTATKPEGRVCFGVATAQEISTSTQDFGALGREKVRRAAVNHGLFLLQQAISRL